MAEAAADCGFGIKVQLAVDIDERALRVYERNFQPVAIYNGSVNRLVNFTLTPDLEVHVEPKLLPPLLEAAGPGIDLVIGGPPCQGHSGFNNKSRRSDPRNSLYLTAVAAAIGCNASCLVLENVPEIRRSDLEVVEGAIKMLRAAGYAVDDGVLSSNELGWPQSRKRHFLVASMQGIVPLAQIKAEYASTSVGAAEFLRDLPKRGGDMDSVPEYSKVTRERISFFERHPGIYDLPNSERPECHKEGTTYKAVYGRMRPMDPIPTLTTGFLTPGRGRFIHPEELRTLTPGEAAYAQGFPSWFSFKLGDASRQDLTKWIGDAVPLPLGYVASLAVLRPLLGLG